MPKAIRHVVEDDEGDEGGGQPNIVFSPRISIPGRRSRTPDDDGPSDDDPPVRRKPQARTEFEEVEIGGKKYRVEKGAAAAIAGQSKKPGEQTSELRQMLEEFTSRFAPPPKKKQKVEDDEGEEGDDDDRFSDTRLFTDTKGFFKDFKKSLSKEILSQISTLYSQDQGQRDFWTGFYSKHSDLKEYDFMVKATLNENAKELGVMRVAEASEKLAEMVRERLLRIAKSMTKGSKKGAQSFHVEGAGDGRRDTREPEEETDDDEEDKKQGIPLTMSGLLKLRRSNRQKPLIRQREQEE